MTANFCQVYNHGFRCLNVTVDTEISAQVTSDFKLALPLKSRPGDRHNL